MRQNQGKEIRLLMGAAKPPRESLGSRLGFLLIAAGCAISLGNIWRFPYLAGQYGGAAFVLIYLVFLVAMGLPVMVMEFSMGRASRTNITGAFRRLEPPGSRWHIYGYLGMCGNYVLMMFYTTVAGWFPAYFYYTVSGRLKGLAPDQTRAFYEATLASPATQLGWMGLVTVIGFTICAMGLRNGVERVAKGIMGGLFAVMMVLAVRAMTLPGAEAGFAFYLRPDFGKFVASGLWGGLYAAMSQALFSLSIGIGGLLIFGSYSGHERTLTGESLNILGLDTFAALVAGLIIFPSCFAFGVEPGAGRGLLLITLPNVFNSMAYGQVWGALFFIFMSFAVLSTVIAIFENIVAFGIDNFGLTRTQSVTGNLVLTLILSAPCALGFSTLSGFAPMGEGTSILDLEDFIVSYNLMPLGSLVFVLFCGSRRGWGWSRFSQEADIGRGPKLPQIFSPYFRYVLPLIILVIFIMGYVELFGQVADPPPGQV